MNAVLDTVIFAVTWFEALNAVELTVTPPGFVVPVINHCALAPFLKPLPDTITLRLVVPCVVELGLALVTVICASACGESTQHRKNRTNNEQKV